MRGFECGFIVERICSVPGVHSDTSLHGGCGSVSAFYRACTRPIFVAGGNGKSLTIVDVRACRRVINHFRLCNGLRRNLSSITTKQAHPLRSIVSSLHDQEGFQ